MRWDLDDRLGALSACRRHGQPNLRGSDRDDTSTVQEAPVLTLEVQLLGQLLDDRLDEFAIQECPKKIVDVRVDYRDKLPAMMETVHAFLQSRFDKTMRLQDATQVEVPLPTGVACAVYGARGSNILTALAAGRRMPEGEEATSCR